jgi:Fic family protein
VHPPVRRRQRTRRTAGHRTPAPSCGYGVGKYVSIEQLIYETRDEYYRSLGASTTGWFEDGQHNVWPWAGYLLGRLDAACTRFGARVAAGTGGGTKQDRVRDFVLLNAATPFTIADIRRAVPGISDNTIRLVLAELRDRQLIANDGTGRSASWHRVNS